MMAARTRARLRTKSNNAANRGTVATKSAAMPDEMRFSATETKPLPPRHNAVPMTAAEAHWRALGAAGRSPFSPGDRNPNASITLPAMDQRNPAARNGGTVRIATRIARYVEPQMM